MGGPILKPDLRLQSPEIKGREVRIPKDWKTRMVWEVPFKMAGGHLLDLKGEQSIVESMQPSPTVRPERAPGPQHTTRTCPRTHALVARNGQESKPAGHHVEAVVFEMVLEGQV